MTAPNTQQGDPILDKARQLRQAGATVDEVKQYLHAKGYDTGDQPEEKPGVFSRAMTNLGHAVMHPIDTAENIVTRPIKSAFTAVVAPGVGEARPDARLSKGGNSSGRPIDTSAYDAEHGGVTPKERTQAGVSTLADLAASGIFRGAKTLASQIPRVGNTLATGAGLATTGAVTGAASNLDDPGAGAIAGSIAAPVMGAVAGPVTKGATKLADLGVKARRMMKATPIDEAAVAHTNATAEATRQNYGKAEAEGAQTPSTPALTKALDHPRVKPFVEMVRDGEEGAAMSDADVATTVYKLMSKQRRGLQRALAVEYDAAKDLQAKRLGGAMTQLRDATAAKSTKPALSLDIAPETYETAPTIAKGHEPASGPVQTKNLSEYTTPPTDPTLRQALRDFPDPSIPATQGPGGPAFQLKGKPDKLVRPGVEIGAPSHMWEPAGDMRFAESFFENATSEGKALMLGMQSPDQFPALAGNRAWGQLSAAEKLKVAKFLQPDQNSRSSPVPWEKPGGGSMRIQTAPSEEVGPSMPSFPNAVAERAKAGRARDLFNKGVEGAKRIASGKQPAPKKLDTQSRAAFMNDIATMSPEDAASTLKGLLGGGREEIKFHAPSTERPSLAANIVQPGFRLNRLSPAIDALDNITGRTPQSLTERFAKLQPDQILQLLGIPAGTISRP